MILTQRTVDILKNFATINPTGMIWPVGNKISIDPSVSKTMVAIAEIDEENDQRFAILDLMQFYSALSSFDKPEIELDGVKIRIADTGQRDRGTFVFNTASEQIVKEPKGVDFPEDGAVTFEFTQQMVLRLFKGIGIIAAPKIAIKGDGSEMFAIGYDPENTGMNQYRIPLATTTSKFTFVFEVDHLTKLMKGMDYITSISKKGIARFKGDRIVYYVASKTIDD